MLWNLAPLFTRPSLFRLTFHCLVIQCSYSSRLSSHSVSPWAVSSKLTASASVCMSTILGILLPMQTCRLSSRSVCQTAFAKLRLLKFNLFTFKPTTVAHLISPFPISVSSTIIHPPTEARNLGWGCHPWYLFTTSPSEIRHWVLFPLHPCKGMRPKNRAWGIAALHYTQITHWTGHLGPVILRS